MAPANHGGMSRHRLVYNDEGLRPGLFSFRPAGALVGWSELHSRKYRVSTWLRQAPGFRFPDSLLRAGGIYVLQLLRCSESS
jgi:hypothetical protein